MPAEKLHRDDVVVVAARMESLRAQGADIAAQIRECEERLAALTGFRKPEGQTTYDVEGSEALCRVVIKQPVTTTVDTDLWLETRKSLPKRHPARAIFAQRFQLKTKEARALQESDKEAYLAVAKCIQRKPGKLSVKVEKLVAKEAT